MNATVNTPAVSLATLATAEAISAIRADDRAQFNATVSLALVMASRQADSAGTDIGIDEKKNSAYFRGFLKQLAHKGVMVWRDTQHMIDAIQAVKGEKRVKGAAEYIDKKEKGARLTDGLARLKTFSFKLMKDVHTNHAGVIREMAQMQTDGIGAEAIRDRFLNFVKSTYGDSFAKLSGALTEEKAPAAKVDPVESIVKRASEMTLTDLARLAAQIQALYSERMADESAGSEAAGEAETETVAEGEEAPIAAAA